MRRFAILVFCLPFTSYILAQQAPSDYQNYVSYGIALIPAKPGGDVILPFLTADHTVVFYRVSEVQQASKENRVLGRPITYGEVLALIGQLETEATQLKQENEKLWGVVGKSDPPAATAAPTTQPQQPSVSQPLSNNSSAAVTRYLLLRQLFPQGQPYQLPPPAAPNNGINCTTTHIGSTAYTNCHCCPAKTRTESVG